MEFVEQRNKCLQINGNGNRKIPVFGQLEITEIFVSFLSLG